MTRDDIFWLALRFLMLRFFYVGVTAIYTVPDSGMPESGRGAMLVPFLAAIALYAVTERSKLDEGKREVHFSMRREDLLWIACKVVGLILIFMAVDALVEIFSSLTGISAMPVMWSLHILVVHGALGAWLFFGENQWLLGDKFRARKEECPKA